MCSRFAEKQTRNCTRYLAIFMEPENLKLMLNTFVLSQFRCCPLIWMFHNRNIDNKIIKIQERALRIAHKDNISHFEKLLENDNSVSTVADLEGCEGCKSTGQISKEFCHCGGLRVNDEIKQMKISKIRTIKE